MRRANGFTLIELMIVIAIIAIIAALAIPSILSATRSANERNASGSLKQIGSVEVQFKTSDVAQDGLNAYWVLDVVGFYRIASGNIAANEGVKLIELAVAIADAAPQAAPAGLNYSTVNTVASFTPKAGYWFLALTNYGTGAATSSPYNASLGRNFDRFGYIAVPNTVGSSGRLVFILNENGTMYKKDPGTGAALSVSAPVVGPAPGGVLTVAFNTFPYDPVGSGWSKMD